MHKEIKRELISTTIFPIVLIILVLMFGYLGLIHEDISEVLNWFVILSALATCICVVISYWFVFKRK